MYTLPAPYLEEKIPSQYKEIGFKIPFSLNRAVGIQDFSSMYLKVKTISTNVILYVLKTQDIRIEDNQYYAYFNFPAEELNSSTSKMEIGQFYKAQLAGGSDDEPGVYSTVTVFKYTNKPEIKLFNSEGEESPQYNNNTIFFFGGVLNNSDITEKIAQYKFDLYDEKNNLIDSTGYLFHDVANDHVSVTLANGDNKKASIDSYEIKTTLQENRNYYLIYTAKTINKLIVVSKTYHIMNEEQIDLPFPGELLIQPNNEEGYFSLLIDFNQNKNIYGTYRILRTDERSNYSQWENLKDISFSNFVIFPKKRIEIFKDFYIEHGIRYAYAIQQYSPRDQLYIKKNYFKKILNYDGTIKEQIYFKSDFEDLFLSDGKQQLKIRFNPKVNSFKDNIPESKIDTIGSQYPFFFRNGFTKYKDFSISGLISCKMDDNHMFCPHKDFNADLTSDNILEERKFKLAVLNWLNNGELKIFRSPTEGNYIIRLMKVSLKPIDKLGRMLHNFSATAYEAKNYSINDLKLNHLFEDNSEKYNNYSSKTITLTESKSEIPEAESAKIFNGIFREKIIIYYKFSKPVEIYLGTTGDYNLKASKENPIIGVKSCSNQTHAQFLYNFIDNEKSSVILDASGKTIKNIIIEDRIEQYSTNSKDINIIDLISSKNNRQKIIKINYLRFRRKDSVKEIKKETSKTQIKLDTDQIDYHYWIKEQSQEINENFLLNEWTSYQITDNAIEAIKIGNGIYLDICYTLGTYEIEKEV